MEKDIYIVLSQSGSMPSKLLKFFTHDEFNHVSISLDQSLETMYSFARLKPNNPFKGGFVEEGKNKGTFKRFDSTIVMVSKISVSEEKYNSIKYFIDYFVQHKVEFKYNYLGVFLAGLKLNIKRRRKFYCSQFVREVLANLDIENASQLPKIAKPIDFLKLNNNHIIYKGLLKNYIGI